jgi:ABC-type Fe3+/spermidine/putrescine transport system ATPase subunit
MNDGKPLIRINNLTKSFGAFKALDNISLDIAEGSFTTLLGPSGCGKTTFLRSIAGFYEPDSGDIYMEGIRINGLPPHKRNTPLVFQEYALFPHMTIFENVSYGLKLVKMPGEQIAKKVGEVLELFSLTGLEQRYPKQLSGGQQQRVAFARAFVLGRRVLLLDEPLSNLDAKLRLEVRDELRALQLKHGMTMVYVTHDQEEALAMSDKIAVFEKGRICQSGTPWEIYFRPSNRFVAGFVGLANFIEAEITGLEGQSVFAKHGTEVFEINNNGYEIRKGDRITVLVRPECIIMGLGDWVQAERPNTLHGVIQSGSFLGRTARYTVDAGEMLFTVDDNDPGMHGLLQGKVTVLLDKNKMHILPGLEG